MLANIYQHHMMKGKILNVELSEQNQLVIEEFIKKFLPKRGNKRKNSGNEINYIHKTLDFIFFKNFQFRLTKNHVIDTFQKLGYDIFFKKAKFASNSNSHYPIKYLTMGKLRSDFDFDYAHVDIEATQVRLLNATRYHQSTALDKERIISIEQLSAELLLFQNQFSNKI